MTSRDRVRAVLNHETPDRLPIDLGGSRGTGISAEAYLNLGEMLKPGKDDLPYVFDFVQQLAYPERWCLDRFNIDVIDGGQAFRREQDRCHVWELNSGRNVLVPDYFKYTPDEEGGFLLYDFSNESQIGRKEESTLYFSQTECVYQSLPAIPESIVPADLGKNLYALPIHPWDIDLNDSEQFDCFVNKVRTLYEETEYSISFTVGCQIFEMGQYVRGMENFFCDLYVDESGVRRLLDSLLERYMNRLEKVIEGVGQYVDMLRFVDDLGTQQAPLLNPEKYREIIKPYHKHMWDYVHKNSDCKVVLHSCGAVTDVIPDLIEAGVDVLNPVQISCAGMEPERLKREFGKDIVFWGGGCDTQTVLPTQTPGRIREHVKELVDVLADDGGMIFAQIHNIQADVPPENIIAMLDAAHEFGRY